MSRNSLILTGILVIGLVAAGCSGDEVTGGDEPDPEPEPVVCDDPFQASPSDYTVAGFYPSWKHSVLSPGAIRWDKVTRVIYAFAIPRSDGRLDVSDLTLVDELVEQGHANGVEVFFSIGGGGTSENLPIIAGNDRARRDFVRIVRDYMGAHCLDGVDVDWESWTKDSNNRPVASEKAALVALLTELRAELEPFGLKTSVDVYGSNWFGQHYDDEVHALVDDVQIMAYDFSGPWSPPGPHSSFEQAIGSGSSVSSTGLAYWANYRGWPRSKLVLGVPFYGRDFDSGGGQGIAYSDIVDRYPSAPDADRVANIYYNGIQTMTDKTRFVKDNGFAGMMIWELAHDTQDESISLLRAIDEVLSTSSTKRGPHLAMSSAD